MPIGYKNGTDGTTTVAINAMQAAARPHHFLGINRDGHASIVSTTGNPDGHMVLRGGNSGTNYHLEAVTEVVNQLARVGLCQKIMIDCSHGNSNKDFRRQVDVLRAVVSQIQDASTNVMGVMLESHLVEGNQKLSSDVTTLVYGQSITDACIDIATTQNLLEELSAVVKTRPKYSN